jgi:hypothetical protein
MHAKARRREVGVLVDDALEAVLQEGCAEVVGQELFGMNRVDVFDRLQFDDQLSIDQQIQPKAFVKLYPIVTPQ